MILDDDNKITTNIIKRSEELVSLKRKLKVAIDDSVRAYRSGQGTLLVVLVFDTVDPRYYEPLTQITYRIIVDISTPDIYDRTLERLQSFMEDNNRTITAIYRETNR